MSIYPSVCGGYGVKGDPGPPGPPGKSGSLLDSWRGPWRGDVEYEPGDLVGHQGSVYLLGGTPSVPSAWTLTPWGLRGVEPPDAPWEMFAAKGADGHGGGGTFSWKGLWDSATAYVPDDLVEYDGSSFIASAAVTAGVAPPGAPWDLVAQKGMPGPVGASGPAGQTGPAGPTGANGSEGKPGPAGPQGAVVDSFKGEWTSDLPYAKGDLTQADGSLWVATDAAAQGVKPPEAPWKVMATKGIQGVQGNPGPGGKEGPEGKQGERGIPGISWVGPWQADADYLKTNAVEHKGSSYFLSQNVGPTERPEPPAAPWQVMADKGTDGTKGEKGDTGSPGTPGEKGAAGTPGIPVDWLDAWSASVAYKPFESVFHKGSTYLTMEDTTGSEPPAAPWKVYAKGTDSSAPQSQNKIQHVWFMRDGSQAAVFSSDGSTWVKDTTWPAQMTVTVPEDGSMVKVTIMGGILSRDTGTEGIMMRWRQETPAEGAAFGSSNQPPHTFSMIGGSGRLVGMALADTFENCTAGDYSLMVQTYYTDQDGDRSVFPGPNNNPDLKTIMDAAVHIEIFPAALVQNMR